MCKKRYLGAIAAVVAVAAVLACLAGCIFSVRVQEPEKPEPEKVELGKDILYLDKGEEIPGRLECIKPDGTYVFTNRENKTLEYPADKVLRVEFERKRLDDDKKETSEIQDPILQEALKREVTTELYPNAAYVTIFDSLKVVVQKDLSATLTRRTIRKVLTRRGMWIANNHVDYLADRAEAKIVFARTITPEGKLKHVEESAIEDGSRFGRYPQYDNARRLKWALKEVNLGSYTDCCYEVKYKPCSIFKPLYETQFLRWTQPIVYCEVVVETPPDVEAVVTGVGTEGNDRISRFEQSGPEGKKYGVIAVNMPRLERENMMPPRADVLPWVAVSLKDSWEKIGDKYGREIAKLLPRKGSRNPVIIKAQELAEGKKTELDKARAIYNFVARDIGFLDIPPDQYSFIPHKPAEVLAAGQANALDKAFLLHAMLRSVNIGSFIRLAHRRDSGQLPRENASLRPMDTPIVYVLADGEEHYCYPTTQVIPFGYVPSGVQGSLALAAELRSKGLCEIPVRPSSKEAIFTESDIELFADGRIRVKRTERLQGGSETSRRKWSKLRPEELAQKFESIVTSIHPNAKLIDYSPKSPKELGDLNKPVVIEYEYEVEGYALTAGGEILVFRIPELNYSASEIEKYDRDLPMFWGRRRMFNNRATIKLPKGFKVKTMPAQARSFEGTKPFMWYVAGFSAKGDTIVFKDRFERSSVYEPRQGYPVFIRTIKEMAGLAKKWIVVEKEK
jgi:hypothetical protein